MPDNRPKPGSQHRTLINSSGSYEVCDWAARFGVTQEKLLEAIRSVGNRADDVEAYLKNADEQSLG